MLVYQDMWLLGTKDPVCVRTRGMVSTLGYDGLRGLLHPIPGTESCQSCYTKGQPGVAEGYDSSDILKLQRDLRQAKKVVEKHKVVKKWEEHFSVRAELRGSIAPWMRLHEPFGDEAAIIQFRGFQIMMKLYAKVNMDADALREERKTGITSAFFFSRAYSLTKVLGSYFSVVRPRKPEVNKEKMVVSIIF
ncbi:hypothetical protein BS47DRAFT_1381895 [Hydnum rufescens UP504]|uniref:Uncharacterized protein n=1 Tax=Hydnum rufescens UP504 TaxID=1448309 RepID=A0A9P6AYX9_9AGAM|nr:hypothetical protein BS47DRAFT_1381895 [Hydnum rufescens UP504]